MPTEETRKHVSALFNKFNKEQVVKLLSIVDEEGMISRGTVGQSVEAIVSSLVQCENLLNSIMADRILPLHVREVAGIIASMKWPEDTIEKLRQLESEGSWYAGEIIRRIRQWGGFDPYA